jgi:ATP-dependent DNA ligase
MKLQLKEPILPMDALPVEKIPEGQGWLYEPKWDGFRCLVFRDGAKVFLQSKSGQPLARYFPELADAFRKLKARRFVLDGEIAIPIGKKFSFDDLLERIHPAESRVQKLSRDHPATFIAFDLLAGEDGKSLLKLPLKERRKKLEKFAKENFRSHSGVRLSPATSKLEAAKKWFARVGTDLDGIVAKNLDCDYRAGERSGMEKIKLHRTADCVVGGFRYAAKGKVVGSLLLGLYDDRGLLNHVGFCSGLKTEERRALVTKLKPLIEPPGFTGHAPGGPSRWSTKRSSEWEPLKPKLVVEVSYDHFTNERFRHGTRLIRWRPDKAPGQCRMEQVAAPGRGAMALLEEAA